MLGFIDNRKVKSFDTDYEKIKEIDDFHSLKPQPIDSNLEYFTKVYESFNHSNSPLKINNNPYRNLTA